MSGFLPMDTSVEAMEHEDIGAKSEKKVVKSVQEETEDLRRSKEDAHLQDLKAKVHTIYFIFCS